MLARPGPPTSKDKRACKLLRTFLSTLKEEMQTERERELAKHCGLYFNVAHSCEWHAHLHSAKGGAVEAGCSGLHDVIGCFTM